MLRTREAAAPCLRVPNPGCDQGGRPPFTGNRQGRNRAARGRMGVRTAQEEPIVLDHVRLPEPDARVRPLADATRTFDLEYRQFRMRVAAAHGLSISEFDALTVVTGRRPRSHRNGSRRSCG